MPGSGLWPLARIHAFRGIRTLHVQQALGSGQTFKTRNSPLLAASVIAAIATPTYASPLPTRDQNPLLAGFALPMPAPTRVPDAGEWDLAATLNWGTSAIAKARTGEALIVDAETRELRLTAVRSVSDRLALRGQLPYRYTGGGVLDSFIDSWHDFFGLPEGARPALPQDQIRIAYERDGSVEFDIDESVEGIGDIALGAVYEMYASDTTRATLAFDVELPTGDADRLNGNGAVDLTALVAGDYRFGGRWLLYGQAAASLLGDGDVLPEQQRDVLFSGILGLAFDATSSVRLNVQLDVHSDAFDGSDIEYLNEALILTFGGSFRTQTWQLDVGISEDIAVDASPDFVFILGVTRRH